MGKFSGLELATEKPFRVKLQSPAGGMLKDEEGREAFVDVLSYDSRKSTELRRDRRDRALSQAAPLSSAELDELSAEFLAALTTGWYLVGLDGKPILEDGSPMPFTIDNAKLLYSLPAASWITDQVRAEANKRRNFINAPKGS